MTAELKPCGTRAAYARHLRSGEQPCGACLHANAEETRNARVRGRARIRAFTRLGHRFPEAFAELLAEEMAKEGRDDTDR